VTSAFAFVSFLRSYLFFFFHLIVLLIVRLGELRHRIEEYTERTELLLPQVEVQEEEADKLRVRMRWRRFLSLFFFLYNCLDVGLHLV
jgi:hypothetical protein